MGTGEWIIIGLCILLGGWFVVGNRLNEQKTRQISAWVRGGLKPYGTLGALRRLDPSSIGMRLMPEGRDCPFPRREVLVSLVRRENPPLWLYQKLRGRQDLIIIKANLEKTPREELHLLLKNDAALMNTLNHGGSQPLVFLEEVKGSRLYYRGRQQESSAATVKEFSERYSGCIQRLSLQGKAPHVTLSLFSEAVEGKGGEEFFRKLAEL